VNCLSTARKKHVAISQQPLQQHHQQVQMQLRTKVVA
jgi:hypothetical protein